MCDPTPAAVRKQIAAGHAGSGLPAAGRGRSREVGARGASSPSWSTRGCAPSTSSGSTPATVTTGDRLADGVASLVAAARTLPMMAPRRVVTVLQAETLLAPEARERGGDARARRSSKTCIKQPEPQTTLVLVAAPRRQAQPDVQAAAEAGDDRRVRRASRIRPTPSAGSGPRVAAAGAEIDPAAARLARRSARGIDVKRLRARRRSAAAVRARAEADHASTTSRRGRRAGGAAGRLGDDQRDRGGQAARGAASARADARRRRAAGEDPRAARMAGADEVSGDRAGATSARRSRRCSGPTWTSSGRPATRASCSNGWSSSCVRGSVRGVVARPLVKPA